MLVSLGWWLLAASKVAEERPDDWKNVLDILEDVNWVFDGILAQAQTASHVAGTVGSEGDGQPLKKRARQV